MSKQELQDKLKTLDMVISFRERLEKKSTSGASRETLENDRQERLKVIKQLNQI